MTLDMLANPDSREARDARKAVVDAGMRRIALRAAEACAKMFGYTEAQTAAYADAWCAAPRSLPGPRGTMLAVPLHDIAHAAALAAGSTS